MIVNGERIDWKRCFERGRRRSEKEVVFFKRGCLEAVSREVVQRPGEVREMCRFKRESYFERRENIKEGER